jgi:hypothetical protein
MILKPKLAKLWLEFARNQTHFIGEFDPGSGRTLAACLIHASRADFLKACFEKLAADG